jgi:TolA-binding protein
VNPRSNYAAEALMGAAECYVNAGDKSKARDAYRRVLSEYPESPFVKTAITKLEGLK